MLKNFSTFLNNLPDLEEVGPKSDNKKDDRYVYFRWKTDPSNMSRKVPKEKANEYFEMNSKGGYIPIKL